MHVIAILALGWGACRLFDAHADPAFAAAYGWLVKIALVAGVIALVLLVLPIPWLDAGSGEPDVPVSMEP